MRPEKKGPFGRFMATFRVERTVKPLFPHTPCNEGDQCSNAHHHQPRKKDLRNMFRLGDGHVHRERTDDDSERLTPEEGDAESGDSHRDNSGRDNTQHSENNPLRHLSHPSEYCAPRAADKAAYYPS